MTNASVIKKEMIKKWVLVLVVVVMVGSVISDVDKDKEECADQLVGLATCLPYVSETAKSPTPDCCSGLKKVLDTSKKCLCVLVKDRNDPGLGFKINSTLALSLPSTCKVPANISECPALLHLAPNSPAAQVFEQFDSSSKGATTTPTSSGSPKSGGTSGEASNEKVKSDGGRRNKVELVEGFLLLCFISIYLSFV